MLRILIADSDCYFSYPCIIDINYIYLMSLSSVSTVLAYLTKLSVLVHFESCILARSNGINYGYKRPVCNRKSCKVMMTMNVYSSQILQLRKIQSSKQTEGMSTQHSRNQWVLRGRQQRARCAIVIIFNKGRDRGASIGCTTVGGILASPELVWIQL